jgi:thioesterase domain-containing protein
MEAGTNRPASAFLSRLRERDVRLWVEDGRLKCDAPPGVLDERLRTELAAHKQELLAILAEADASLRAPRSLVPLKPIGDRPPLFLRPGHNGDVFCYRALAELLDPGQPLFGVEPQGLDGTRPAETVEEMAAYEVAQIRAQQPQGPYHLGGYCAGGAIAFESARQLALAGEVVARVLLLGSPFPSAYRADAATRYVRSLRNRGRRHAHALLAGSVSDGLAYTRERFRSRASATARRRDPALDNSRRLEDATVAAVQRYHPGFYPGRVDLFLPSEMWRRSGEQSDEWRLVVDEVVEHVGPDGADADNMLREPHVRGIAPLLNRSLGDAGSPPASG